MRNRFSKTAQQVTSSFQPTRRPTARSITARQEVFPEVPGDQIATTTNAADVVVRIVNTSSAQVTADVAVTDDQGNQQNLSFTVAASDVEAQRVTFQYDFAPSDSGVTIEYCAEITNLVTTA